METMKLSSFFILLAILVTAGHGRQTEHQYKGCYLHANWDRSRTRDVAQTVEGVKQCRQYCKAAGQKYFGMECPMQNRGVVHCECTNDLGKGYKVSDQRCREFNWRERGYHCNGRFEIGGYLLGAAYINSAYEVDPLNKPKTPWTFVPFASLGSFGNSPMSDDAANKAIRGLDAETKIVRRLCSNCAHTHREIYYKRLPNARSDVNFNYADTFKNNWFSANNEFHKDFELYSTLEDALKNRNAWRFCNFNDPSVGFPRDCDPVRPRAYQWNSFSGRHSTNPRRQRNVQFSYLKSLKPEFKYKGCYLHANWDRSKTRDVPQTVAGVKQCQQYCEAAGQKYFGMECPMNNRGVVHCECANDLGRGTKVNDQRCAEFNLQQRGNHCNGRFEVGGYLLGAAHINSAYEVGAPAKEVEYVLTGFAKQSKLNGVYVLRDEKINGAISFAEKDANTILAKGHNGHWWWDDDLADFEHDEMNPDGVWAYAQKGVDFTTANSVTANEWDGGVRQWKPVAISIKRRSQTSAYWKWVGAGRCRTSLNKQPLASIYTGFSNSQQCKNKCQGHSTCIGIQYLGRYRHCWLYGGAFGGRVNLFNGPSKDEITKIAGPESLAECWAWKK